MDGFAFRLLLSTEREVEVRKKLHGEAAVVKQPPSLNLALRSWHHGAMAMLDGQHPAFAPTVRCVWPCFATVSLREEWPGSVCAMSSYC